MPKLNTYDKNALQYIKAAGPDVKKEYFIEDLAPIGITLLKGVIASGWVQVDANDILTLTEKGKEVLQNGEY